MGCGISFICKTCKKVFYLGYGSYGTWFDFPKTIESFTEMAKARPNDATLLKNQNMEKCLIEHGFHDFEFLYHDDQDFEDKVENPEDYEKIDLYDAGDLAFT